MFGIFSFCKGKLWETWDILLVRKNMGKNEFLTNKSIIFISKKTSSQIFIFGEPQYKSQTEKYCSKVEYF